MRKILPGLLLSGALLLSACGGPATTGTSATSTTGGASATSSVDSSLNEAATAVADTIATSAADGTLNEAATAVADTIATSAADGTLNEAATAVSEAAGTLSAVADDVTLQQGEALVLDATNSVGNVANYSWTVLDAPAGAEAVKGQMIAEGSNGNVSLEPADYEKYFPVAGRYTVRLTVTDTSGATSNDDFMIDVP
jgi:hypothetical protein